MFGFALQKEFDWKSMRYENFGFTLQIKTVHEQNHKQVRIKKKSIKFNLNSNILTRTDNEMPVLDYICQISQFSYIFALNATIPTQSSMVCKL